MPHLDFAEDTTTQVTAQPMYLCNVISTPAVLLGPSIISLDRCFQYASARLCNLLSTSFLPLFPNQSFTD